LLVVAIPLTKAAKLVMSTHHRSLQAMPRICDAKEMLNTL